MSHGTALIILAVCFALAFVICAPFFYLAHRRRKAKGVGALTGAKPIPKGDLPALLAFAAVMFFGFTYAYTEPETWFGTLMATNAGRIAFLIAPAITILVLRAAWLRLRRQRNKPNPPSERSDA